MSTKIEQWREMASSHGVRVHGSHLLQACDYLEELEKDLNDLLIENWELLEQIINERSTTQYYVKELEDAKARILEWEQGAEGFLEVDPSAE